LHDTDPSAGNSAGGHRELGIIDHDANHHPNTETDGHPGTDMGGSNHGAQPLVGIAERGFVGRLSGESPAWATLAGITDATTVAPIMMSTGSNI
jgi:hypothetical protein